MRLSEKAINDFKRIYAEKFGIELSKERANELGVSLLHFFKLVYRPIPTSKRPLDIRNIVSGMSR